MAASADSGWMQEIKPETPYYVGSFRGCRIAAKVWGRSDGRPLLGIHGWLDNAATFDRLAPLLGDFRFIAIDLPGHGLSDAKPGEDPYHFIDWPAYIHAVADQLEWDQFSILGHSLGAAIACVYAAAFAERVEKLALIDGLGPITTSANGSAALLRKHIQSWKLAREKRQFESFEQALDTRKRATDLSITAAEHLTRRELNKVAKTRLPGEPINACTARPLFA